MKILTCNVRCFGADDKENGWSYRKDFCAQVIHAQAPHIICFQELWVEQFQDLKPAFSEFESFGMVDTPQGRHPMNAIFYRRETFECISAGGYWLSETPHVAGSSSWESACVRLANWVWLKDVRSGVEFRVVNTHLDHVSQKARENQARIMGHLL